MEGFDAVPGMRFDAAKHITEEPAEGPVPSCCTNFGEAIYKPRRLMFYCARVEQAVEKVY